jgi:hypothetical protein
VEAPAQPARPIVTRRPAWKRRSAMRAHAVSNHRMFVLRTVCALALVLASDAGQGPGAHAATTSSICGDADGDGSIKSSDALASLKVAVGFGECVPPRCDVNNSGSISSSDAVTILGWAIGRQVVLSCPSPSSTTTSSTTSTTLSSTCGNGVVEPGEDCEEGFCRGGCNPVTNLCVDLLCSPECTCPAPECGDSILDPDEICDPPGSACDGGTCSASCECVP